MIKQFKLICMNCGNELVLDEENIGGHLDRYDYKITVFEEMNGIVEIECGCGNLISN